MKVVNHNKIWIILLVIVGSFSNNIQAESKTKKQLAREIYSNSECSSRIIQNSNNNVFVELFGPQPTGFIILDDGGYIFTGSGIRSLNISNVDIPKIGRASCRERV